MASASKGNAAASKCASGTDSIRRFRTIGFTCVSVGCAASAKSSRASAAETPGGGSSESSAAWGRPAPPRAETAEAPPRASPPFASTFSSAFLGAFSALRRSSSAFARVALLASASAARSSASSESRSAAAAAAPAAAPGSCANEFSLWSAAVSRPTASASVATGASPSANPPPLSGRAEELFPLGSSAASAKLSSASASASETSPALSARALSADRFGDGEASRSKAASRAASLAYPAPSSRSRFALAARESRVTSFDRADGACVRDALDPFAGFRAARVVAGERVARESAPSKSRVASASSAPASARGFSRFGLSSRVRAGLAGRSGDSSLALSLARASNAG